MTAAWEGDDVAPADAVLAQTVLAPTDLAPTDLAPTDLAPTDLVPTDVPTSTAPAREPAPVLATAAVGPVRAGLGADDVAPPTATPLTV